MLRSVGIRTAADAFVLLEAVRTGVFPLRRHRLSQAERDDLAPGQVFVWTESSEANGLERWTDGRKWYVCPRQGLTLFISSKLMEYLSFMFMGEPQIGPLRAPATSF